MILDIKSSEIEIIDSKSITKQPWGGVFFEGYFFIGADFYRGEDAIRFVIDHKDSITKNLFKLNGIYICLIYDIEEKKVTIFNDKICFESLCWFLNREKNFFSISNSFFDLQSHLGIHEFDEVSILEFLSYRFVSGKYTLLKGIYQIEPASIYTIDYNGENIQFEKKEWYQYKVSFKGHENGDKELYDIQTRIFDKYKKAFGNNHIQLNLTGGLDSRYILGFLLKNGFNFETNTFGAKQCEEIKYVSVLEENYKFNCNRFILRDSFIKSFYDKSTAERITRSIGFKTYYYQGYFFDLLFAKKNDDIMMSGDNGFIHGLMYKDSVRQIKSHDELADFLVKTSVVMPYKELQSFYQKCPSSEQLFDKLKSRVMEQLDLTNDIYSEYLKWGLFNRERNYCDKNYLVYSKYTFPVYPNYDDEFINFMLNCSPDELRNEQVYRDSMCNYLFVGPLEGLRKVPVDQRGVIRKTTPKNWNFASSSLYLKMRNIDVRFAEHFNIRSNYLSVPFDLIKRNQTSFHSFLDMTFDGSKLLNASSIKKASKKNTRSFYAMRLSILASFATFEKLLRE